MLISVEVISIKLAGLFIVFYIENTKVVGIALILCGVILILTIQLWGIPGFVLYTVCGIVALRGNQTRLNVLYITRCLICGKELKGIDPNFIQNHRIDNPSHLEYKVVVEAGSINDTNRKILFIHNYKIIKILTILMSKTISSTTRLLKRII